MKQRKLDLLILTERCSLFDIYTILITFETSLKSHLSVVIFYFLACANIYAQNNVSGVVKDQQSKPIAYATVFLQGSNMATTTNKDGYFELSIPPESSQTLIVKFLGYKEFTTKIIAPKNQNITLDVVLLQDIKTISTVDIEGKNIRREEASMMVIDPRETKMLPSAFGDFNKVLQALPGVSTNSELSSTYAVRGGNYDENAIFVNGIEVYRPFLVSSGQQEGLSFVNPNLAAGVEFSTGGWQAKYGDKLSSILNVSYKKPTRAEGSATLSMLGGTAHIGGVDKKNRVTFMLGFRNKSGRYLLNSLPVQGQYFPSFNDLQIFTTLDLTNRKKEFAIAKRTELSILATYAQNRFSIIPQLQETSFGTSDQVLLFKVDFEGTEKMNYDTYQGGAKLSHWVTSNFRTEWYISGMDTREREFINLEAGYQLCDVNPEPGIAERNKCAVTRGIGTQFRYARNSLHSTVIGSESRNYLKINQSLQLEFGSKYTHESFTDILQQYSFNDSLDYAIFNPRFTTFPALNSNIQLNTNRMASYAQATIRIDSTQKITIGTRVGWWDLNRQWLFSPNMQYSYKPAWKKDIIFKCATGIYRQPPFYRELRNFEGQINPNVKAQSSIHIVAGIDYAFKSGRKNFRLTSEIYYKHIWDVVPYDIDNVRLRYYAKNNAIAYATGIDTRISGELIRGSESWFSISFMQTKEKIDNGPWISRPTDQRINFATYIQDHVPGIPAWKVYLSLFFGAGLPVSLPNTPDKRSFITAPAYRRVDIGTHYTLFYNDKTISKKLFESITLGIEILNLFGINNTISYQWIADFNNRYYAVPNTLSQRFINAKVSATF